MARKKAPAPVGTSMTSEEVERKLAAEAIIVIPPALDASQADINALIEADVSGSMDSRKPSISHLPQATAKDETGAIIPLFDVGDKLVIERHAFLLKERPWLDTQTYIVQSINDETGDLKLWNPDVLQFALGNFITGPARGDDYRLAVEGAPQIGKRKRGRPRKHPVQPVAQKPAGEKRGRGRPKGSKNRPKDVIKAEKVEKSKVRAAKAASRRRKVR